MQPDGTLKERVGTAEFIYSFSKTHDDKFVKKCIKTAGVMLEEGMNTVLEENAMANYMGISLEEMQKEFRSLLIPQSDYQGYIADFVRYMLENLGKDDFESYRLYGETKSKDKINDLMGKTNYWINRETDILPSTDSPRSYDKKRAVFDRIDGISIQEFFNKYKTIYFPDISKMTPIEKIDNVLSQRYTLKMVRYNMGIDNYRDFLDILGYEGYSLVNQAVDLKRLQELSQVVSNVRSSELSGIICETKNIALENALE